VLLDEEDITSLPMYLRARKGINYLPQEPSVFRKLTVAENVLAVLENMPFTKAARYEEMERLLQDLGVTHLAKHKAHSLSGGERRRVEICRALYLPACAARRAVCRHRPDRDGHPAARAILKAGTSGS
jgi:lipopolysaccharide export system ATP-binding protein